MNFSKYSDDNLMNLIYTDDKYKDAAFLELYNRYSKSVFAYCKSMYYNYDLAKDSFELIMIDFFKAIKSGKQIENCLGYLLGIARKKLQSYLRDKGKNSKVVFVGSNDYSAENNKQILDFDDPSADIERNYENNEFIKIIENTIELLEDDEKELYVLNKFGGISAGEIAKSLNLNVNYVKTKINRASIKIKEILAPYIKELNNI